MNFRATAFSVSQRAIQYSTLHNADLVKYQEQISSGIRLQKPSDDPIAYRQVTSLTSRLSELSADTQSINGARSVLQMGSVQIQAYANIMSSAKNLAQQGVAAIDDDARNALMLEVDGLLNQLKNISVSQFDGAFIFGGTNSNTVPFEFSEPDNDHATLQVRYFGSERHSQAHVGDSISVDTYYSGNAIFDAPERGETIHFGTTGLQSGSGTDTIKGRATLELTHETTTYFGGSGIQPASNSALDDTIIGEQGTHVLTVNDTAGDGSAGTISLNGGPPVPFTSSDSQLLVEDVAGQRVYVDASAITPGFNGDVDIEATGSISIAGSDETYPVEFGDQIIEDSRTGDFVTVDSTTVKQTGNEYFEFPGTSNAFQVLYELREDLRNSRELSAGDVARSINRRIGDLDKLSEHALGILGTQSTSLQTLETLSFRIQDLELAVESQLSDIQATNIPEAVLRMENSQALLNYTYAVTSRLSNLGLLNFLQ